MMKPFYPSKPVVDVLVSMKVDNYAKIGVRSGIQCFRKQRDRAMERRELASDK